MIPLLSSTYKSIDVRIMIVRSSSKDQWHCAFLKVRFAKETQAELQGIYNNKVESLGRIDYDKFKVVLEARPSNEMLQFLDRLQEMHLRLVTLNIDLRLIVTDYQEIYDNEKNFDFYEFYTNRSERCDYLHKSIVIDTNETPLNAIERFIRLDEYDVATEDLENYFDAESLFHSNHNGIIYFPLYCKVENVPTKKKGNWYAMINIHPSLVLSSKAIVRTKDPQSVNKLSLTDLEQVPTEKEFVLIYVPTIKQNSTEIQIQVKHEQLGVIADRTFSASTPKSDTELATHEQYMIMPLEELIKVHERDLLEFKPRLILEDNKKLNKVQIKILQNVVSFMNAESGGVLIMGIKNDRQICGIDEDFKRFPLKKQNFDSWSLHFDDLIEGHIGTLFTQYIQIESEIYEKRTIARIRVKKGTKPAYLRYFDEERKIERVEFYIRTNGSSKPLIGNQIIDYVKEHWS
jgi:hypothetical protein